MPVISNVVIADKLLELAQFLAEHKGNAFKVKAYRRAARAYYSGRIGRVPGEPELNCECLGMRGRAISGFGSLAVGDPWPEIL